MNGHCDFHTFETAVDVCDLCYGDLCRSCALPMKGRKDRVCKDCALTVSGIRGNGRPEVRGDRRTVKSRRKAYASAEEPEDFFQFFDADLPPDALVTQVPPPPASKSDREKVAAERSDAGQANTESSGVASEGLGIRRLIGRLKPGQPDVDREVGAVEAIVDDDDAAGRHESAASAGKDADAVSQLADIRRQDHTASPTAASVIGSSDRPDEGVAPSVAGSVDARPVHVPAGLPPDSTVAIPSPLLQGFPDSAPEAANEMPSGFEELSEVTPLADVGFDPPTGTPNPAAHGRAGPSDIDPQLDGPLSADDEIRHAAGKTPPTGAEGSSSFDEERRRTPPPVEEYQSDAREDQLNGSTSAPRPVDQLDQVGEVSPRLRDLVADLSSPETKAETTENPFLKRSRVVSEPNAAPDYSTDPFSEQQSSGSAPDSDESAAHPRVPAPVSPSATPQPTPTPPPTPDPQHAEPAATAQPTPDPHHPEPTPTPPPTPDPLPP